MTEKEKNTETGSEKQPNKEYTLSQKVVIGIVVASVILIIGICIWVGLVSRSKSKKIN